jgi:hypothetical protein
MKTSFTELALVDGTWTEIGTRELKGGYSVIPSGISQAPSRIILDIMDPVLGIVGQDETYAKETSEELQGYS